MDVGELRIYKFIYTYKLSFTWLSYKYHTKKEFPTPYTPKPFNALNQTRYAHFTARTIAPSQQDGKRIRHIYITYPSVIVDKWHTPTAEWKTQGAACKKNVFLDLPIQFNNSI